MAFIGNFLAKPSAKCKVATASLVFLLGAQKINTMMWNETFQKIAPENYTDSAINSIKNKEERQKALIAKLKWELNKADPNIDTLYKVSQNKDLSCFGRQHPVKQALKNHMMSQFYGDDRANLIYGYDTAWYYGELPSALGFV